MLFKRLLILLVPLAIVIGVSIWLQPSSPEADVWLFNGHKWQKAWELPATPVDTQASETGVLWVSTRPIGFSRFDGKRWKCWSAKDLGVRADVVLREFSVSGGALWAAMSDGVLHFNGSNWERFAVSDKPNSIAANGQEAWTVESGGTLVHYGPKGPEASSLREAMPVRWAKGTGVARIAYGAGHLWIVRQGVWRQNGPQWSAVDLPPRVRLLRASRDRVLFADSKSVISVRGDGTIENTYPFEEGASSAVFSADRLWIATWEGLWSAAANRERIKLPRGVEAVRGLAAFPGGGIWAVAENVEPPRLSGATLLGLFWIILLTGGWITMLILKRLKPWFPKPLRPELRYLWQIVSCWTMLYVMVRAWHWVPNPSGQPVTAVTMCALIVLNSIVALSRNQQTRRQSAFDLAFGLIFMTAWLWALESAFAIFKYPAVNATAMFVGWCAILIARRLFAHWAHGSVTAAMEKGHYDEALMRADQGLGIFGNRATLHYIRGTILLFAGRLVDAEKELRLALDAGSGVPRGRLGFVRINLGYTLTRQRRFDEAQQAFEEAGAMLPDPLLSYTGLARILLEQRREPQRALELIDQATKALQRGASTARATPDISASLYICRAEALALLGRMEEAEHDLTKGKEAPEPKTVPLRAGRYLSVGIALLLMGREAEAVDQLKQAQQIDRSGYSGKRAGQMLAEHASGIRPLTPPLAGDDPAT